MALERFISNFLDKMHYNLLLLIQIKYAGIKKIKILKVFRIVIFKVQRKLICREDSIIILRDDTLANSQLKTSFMDGRGGGGNIELNLYQERRETRGGNELVEIVWVCERERERERDGYEY